jgi:hypothetical protein
MNFRSLFFFGVVAVSAATAASAQYKTYYKLVAARNANLVMEVRGASLGQNATIQSGIDDGGPHQQFEFPRAGSGSLMVSRRSGMAVDIANASSSSWAVIQQFPVHGGANQQWYVQGIGGGLVRIVSVHTGKCLGLYENGSSVPIRQTPYTGNIGDMWRLVIVRSVVEEKYTARHSGKALEVRNGDMQPHVGTPIQQAAYVGHPRQIWFTEFLGGRRNLFVSRCTDQAIDVPGGSATALMNVFPRHGGPNQQFDLLPDSSWTFYKLRSVHTGRVLGVEWGAFNDGARIAQFFDTNAWLAMWSVAFAN